MVQKKHNISFPSVFLSLVLSFLPSFLPSFFLVLSDRQRKETVPGPRGLGRGLRGWDQDGGAGRCGAMGEDFVFGVGALFLCKENWVPQVPDLSPLFWLGGQAPSKIDYRNKLVPLILTSLLEDLENNRRTVPFGGSSCLRKRWAFLGNPTHPPNRLASAAGGEKKHGVVSAADLFSRPKRA